MRQVLTLVADAGHGLGPDLVRAAAAALGPAAEAGDPDWLAPGLACDVPFAAPAPADVAAVRVALAEVPVDFAIQPAANRRKRLLVADMDSTIVTGETLDELAAEAGIGEAVAAITARAMNGEIDFKGALRERVGLLKGLPAAALDRALARVALSPGAETLVRTMRAHGAYALLVSGGFRFFTGRVRDMVGFDEDRSNELEIADGALTGRVREPILDKDAKLATLRKAAAARGLALADCVTVGDGANDLPMLKAAGLGVAWRAKPAVAAEVAVRVDYADLTALLYFQGYRREIIEGT